MDISTQKQQTGVKSPVQSPTSPNATQNTQIQHKPKKNKKYLFFAFIILLVIVTVGIGSFFLGKQKATEEIAQNNNQESTEFTAESLKRVLIPTSTEIDEEPDEITSTPKTTTKIVQADPELDGYVASNGILSEKKDLKIGSDKDGVYRGFVGFDLSSIPTGVTIKAAQLRLYQAKTVGTPYTLTGEIRIDHMSFGDSLKDSDYSTPALVGNISTLSTSKRIGWKEADVTNAVRDDFANARSMSQFRIHFSKEVKVETKQGDFVYFISADKSTSQNIPQLVVEYY